MGLTNPGRALERSFLLLIPRKLLTLSDIPSFSTNLSRLASLHALIVGLNLSFLTGALLWFIKITKVVSFESVEVFRKNPFLALYFSFSSSMIFLCLCLLPSAALFTLTIWPFGPPLSRSPLRWRPHKELCFDWSTGLSTGVFLSISENVRPSSSQWIPTKLTSSPTFSYSALTSVSIPLQLFLGSPQTALFPFLNMYKAFLRLLLIYASTGWFPFLSVTNSTKMERLNRAASRAITSCISSSLMPLLSKVSLPPLQVTLTRFTLLSYERTLRLSTSFPISGLARVGEKPRLCKSY